MVASLAATTGLPRIKIVQSLKAVYTRYESNEYPFAIQESDLFEPYATDPDSFLMLVVEPARRAFREARERYLKPYPGVAETLEAVRRPGTSTRASAGATPPAITGRGRVSWSCPAMPRSPAPRGCGASSKTSGSPA